MADDLLDVSRITRGRIELECQPVDLATVVAAAIEAVEPAIRERRHMIDVRSGMPLIVIGDAARLQQCVVNLLTNSAKYTDPGGHIAVAIERIGDRAVISVTDDGSGIPAEIQPVVFDLFVQSKRTLDRAQGGLGIGLSVVRRLVEMHGGSVEVASVGLGHGSTFRILLPVAQLAAIGAAGEAPADVPSLTADGLAQGTDAVTWIVQGSVAKRALDRGRLDQIMLPMSTFDDALNDIPALRAALQSIWLTAKQRDELRSLFDQALGFESSRDRLNRVVAPTVRTCRQGGRPLTEHLGLGPRDNMMWVGYIELLVRRSGG